MSDQTDRETVLRALRYYMETGTPPARLNTHIVAAKALRDAMESDPTTPQSPFTIPGQPTDLGDRLLAEAARLGAQLATCESELHQAPIGCPHCHRDARQQVLLREAAQAVADLRVWRERGETLEQERDAERKLRAVDAAAHIAAQLDRAGLTGTLTQLTKERDLAHASLATLRTEQGRLRDALVSYGMHTADCLNAEAPCSCGFVEALAGDYERTATEPQSVDDVLDIYVPGRWRCLKCAFVLSRATIFMASGEIGSSRDDVMRMTGEVCPNDGELMVRVTWREDAAESREFSERLITDVMEATGAEHLPAALDRMRQAKAALLARGSRGDETAKGGSDE